MVDFSKARPFDPVWWQWLHSRLDLLESRSVVKLYEIQHAQNIAAMQVSSGEGIKGHWDRANGLLLKMFDRMFPWLQGEGSDEKTNSASELSQLWAEAFGDPASPEMQKRIMATAESLGLNPRKA